MKKVNGISPRFFQPVLVCLCLFFLSNSVYPVPAVLPSLGVQDAGTSTENAEKQPYPVPRIDGKVHLDGNLDDAVWQNALQVELKYEVSPGENIAPPVHTKVFLASSDTVLYVGFHCYDPDPKAIRARYNDRDKISDDDWVAISLDTFNDQRRIYTFYSNPLGIQADEVQVRRTANANWDTIWGSAGRITNDGYIVEMAIPFRALGFQRKKGEQLWGFDLVRRYPRNFNHIIDFIPLDRSNDCYICQMEKLIGFAGAHAGKSIQLEPTVSGVLTQERETFPDGDFVEKNKKVDPGITGHWSFTPNMTLSAAVNPDFSHIEADVALLDINTQFALYYPEKRPFFMEGSSIFDTRLKAIYTRALADPDWGIKLTGKEGPHALGFYSAQDSITNLVFPGSYGSASTSMDMNTQGSVLRYRLDVGKRASTIGLLVTDREGDDYFNRVAGIDVYWRFSNTKMLNVQFLGSQTRYPGQIVDDYNQPDGKFTGSALDVFFKHESRNIGYQVYYQQVNPNFRADLGFMPQVGYKRLIALFIAACWRNPGHWYTFMNVTPRFDYAEDSNGNLIHKQASLSIRYQGSMQSILILSGNFGEQAYMGQVFDTNYGTLQFIFQPSKAFTFQFNAIAGSQIDYNNVRQGSSYTVNPVVTYRLGRHIYLYLDHVFEYFKIPQGRLYTANVSNFSFIYQFNRRALLRTILQYRDYDYNAQNYLFPVNPQYQHLFSQVLFSYKINPYTVLFLGYSDDYYGLQHIPITQNNRTFFLKIGYALQL